MRRSSLVGQILGGLLLIAGMLFGYWREHPPFSRSGGPPGGLYTVTVPAYWSQSYLERFRYYSLSAEDDGLSPATVSLSPPKFEWPEEESEHARSRTLEHYKKILKAKDCEWGEDILVAGKDCWRLNANIGPQPTVGGTGMSRDSKSIVILIRGLESLEFRFSAELDDFAEHEKTALEVAKSLTFKL